MQLPIEFVNRMKNKLGEECDAFLASYDYEEVKSLRLNALKYDENADGREEENSANQKKDKKNYEHVVFDELLNNSVIESREGFSNISWESNGYYYDNCVRPGKHPLHEIGAYYIQEASAMAPVSFLNVKPYDRVLDLCAAPGGKSTQIAGYMKGKGILITNEIVKKRSEILSENIERMGIKNAIVVSEDPRNLEKKLPMFFDKILVDAPCSGEGMFRRGEVAREEWSLDNVKECANRQEWILDCAANMLAPGGRLVYSTCTFSDEEDENQVREFLKRHPDFTDISANMPLSQGMENGSDGVGIRLWPHKVKGEGHFLAVFEKSSGAIENEEFRGCIASNNSNNQINIRANKAKNIPVGGFEKSLNDKQKSKLKPMYDFLDEYFIREEDDLKENKTCNINDGDRLKDCFIFDIYKNNRGLTVFGDNIYLMPEETPSLNGLKVLRPGLQIGSIVKDRFIPSHSLALSINLSDFKNIARIDNDVIYKYLNGETFNYDGKNGWYLIVYKDMPAGFGKLANGIMKNHYPKGLRKNRAHFS